ncbi:MAG: HAD family phosphatase [Planctomycetaceae bacterium]
MNVLNGRPVIKAVVFDLDGLMLNTEDIFDLAGRQLLNRRGMQMTEQIHRSMLGRRPDEAFQAMKDLTGITDRIEDLKSETRELFAEIAAHHLAMMPGLLELLDLIEERNLPKAVATSSPRDYLLDMLTRFDLLHRFPLTLTAEDVTHGKPHPEIYLSAATQLSVDPANVLVLEDSETGTRAAASAGAFTVSVPNQHTHRGDFSMTSLLARSLSDPQLLGLLAPSVQTARVQETGGVQ